MDMPLALAHVRYWPLADIPSCAAHVRFGPKADIQSDYVRSGRTSLDGPDLYGALSFFETMPSPKIIRLEYSVPSLVAGIPIHEAACEPTSQRAKCLAALF
jgi:hypothetical protein